MRELAADHGADLGHLLDRREAVEPGHQRVVQRRRDRERRQRAGQLVAVARVRAAGPTSSTVLVSSSTNSGTPSVLATICVERPRPAAPCRRRPGSTIAAPCAPAEPAQRERGDVRLAGPGRAELRPEGDQQQHRQALDALDHQAEQLQRGRVDPVHVLVAPAAPAARAARPVELVDQRLQRPLLLRRCGVSSSGG